MKPLGPLFCLLAALSLRVAANAVEFPVSTRPDRISYDSAGLQIDGRDFFVFSGAFHYFRCPKELWPARFQKMKEAGLNCVETYVPWNWHEREEPKAPGDFSRIRRLEELDTWLRMAESYGLHVIIRPGPYICAEWDGGGFPQWLVSRKKPATWPAGSSWLQTDDPEYLEWSLHWYKAVLEVVRPHQITRKAPGEPGVILFQIENEYERLKWLSKEVKKRHLEALAEGARTLGVEVPIFTCYTSESRGVQSGPLHGVWDMINHYPKWDIAKQINKWTERQRPQQPKAPLMSAELQGGWYSEVGGKLSDQLEGTSPQHLQNITLYELQLGYSLINYYMFFGGTNFDDWASRDTTTSYDFAAAIREHGGVGEKYRRACALGAMLREHGTRLMRSCSVELEATGLDPKVSVAARKTEGGDFYLFVRTEDLEKAHEGSVRIKRQDTGECLDVAYALEPFGSKVLHLPRDRAVGAGEWLPKEVPPLRRPEIIPDPVCIRAVASEDASRPSRWQTLGATQRLDDYGIVDRHPVYYRVRPPAGELFQISRIGPRLINDTKADDVLVEVGGRMLEPVVSTQEELGFEMPAGATEAHVLFINRGLHQHTKPMLEEYWANGIRRIRSKGLSLPLEFASDEVQQGLSYSGGGLADGTPCLELPFEASRSALLTWIRASFALPAYDRGVWFPWVLHVEARGSGFIYLNGRCLGRYWEEGPQHDFFVPECWLNFGEGASNHLAISLSPLQGRVRIERLEMRPLAEFAEFR